MTNHTIGRGSVRSDQNWIGLPITDETGLYADPNITILTCGTCGSAILQHPDSTLFQRLHGESATDRHERYHRMVERRTSVALTSILISILLFIFHLLHLLLTHNR